MRGAKIDARRHGDAPIVFTSSRAAGQRQPGDWGGLIIIGNAPNNRSGNVEVEGTGTDGTTVVGGKNYQVLVLRRHDATDNSGTLQYVRVEFAGYAPSLEQRVQRVHLRRCRLGHARVVSSRRWRGSTTRTSSLAAASTSITSSRTRRATTCSTCRKAGRPPAVSSSAINSVQLTPRTGAGFYSRRHRRHRERRLQWHGLRPRLQLGAVHDSARRELHADRLRRAVVRRRRRRPRHDAPPRHGRLLRQWCGRALPGRRRLAPRPGDVRSAAAATRRRTSATADLQIRNVLFAEINGTLFQANRDAGRRSSRSTRRATPDDEHGDGRVAVHRDPGDRRGPGRHRPRST